MKLSILYDNYGSDVNLQTDWGFSCLIEGLDKTILFDTGAQGDILLDNMSRMQHDPGQVEAIVLSHDHWDHTGGLDAVLKGNSQVTVFLHPSFAVSLKDDIVQTGSQYMEVNRGMQICTHAFSTGEMGSGISEQALAVDTDEGLVVVTGCAHPGVVSMVAQARELSGKQVHLVLGGFHMRDFSDEQINLVISELRQLGVRKVAPSHCSGDRTRQLFATAFGDDFIEVGVGKRLTITA